MSAPQRSSGRLVSRRLPPSTGLPGNPLTAGPARVSGLGRSRGPLAAPTLPSAEITSGELAILAATPEARRTAGSRKSRRGAERAKATGNDRAARPVRRSGPVTDTGGRVRGVPASTVLPAGPHPVELAGLLHELSVRLLGADDMPQALDRLAAFAASAVPGALRCSVTLIGEGGPPVVAASGPRAQALDDLQYATGQGPALEAARNRVLVTAQELQNDPRWPELAVCARVEGVHGIVSIPLDVQRTSVGALSLFVAEPGGVDPELLLTTMALVNQAEVLLGELRRRESLAEGATVDRAAGVIIAQRGCGVQEAYDVLRETSQRLGIDRRAVAERLIAAAARNAES
ncbi:GAF and ANTAR domain-containing protein [Actinoplanes friuliensis]|nr:GAF and ANTAR domain-containing protein [Actinoplanes friuliensis]